MNAPLNRRNFLTRTAGAGLVLGAPAILRAAEGGSQKINVALVGFGKQGKVLFEAMSNIPGLHFQAVCDIWDYNLKAAMAKVRARQGSVPKGYSDIDEMLATEKGLDAAVVATPDFWHSPHTVKCLEAGLNVYCEKMMSNTIDGARDMVRAMERTGKLCQIGHQRRSNPRYLYTLHELIQGKKICGQIVNINGQWNRAVTASQDIGYNPKLSIAPEVLEKYGFANMHQFMNWRTYRDLSGGPISDLGAHQIDIFNWFLGVAPKSVFATGGHSFFKEREHFDNVMALFDYDTPQGQVRAFYQVLTTTSAGGGYFESFMGTEATIDISERSAYTNIFRESSAPSWDELVSRGYLKKGTAPAAKADSGDAIKSYESAAPEVYQLPGDLNKPPHQPHLENFFASVRGEATLNCDARHAFESEAPIYWVNPSAIQKQRIELTEEHLTV
ncbi:putative dehydrogenase [Haloferula luteola]|uniref:Putative dehydrogenase n=1 Tax=Haloferula luteola TaxID=595692 RepID=A0A840V4L9_9BACT|nr:Gfo/Idh/MocA family oxidoreductase [Haloferula luteola]MBB5353227.1 putative dehydrogenase [Haloferula luteola]